ncbi:DNA-binding protein [Streptacidiphilus neutrinimicus]|uniref:DNA-binding protein n=1 Tax=Streptacidiphilus neutrinimicus TaxID=105420 RepID=UPI0005A90419|nr:DNA-binding protein [Streptacidiphilus neutrinimicus]
MAGTLLLDSEGLSKLYLNDRLIVAYVAAAMQEGVRVATTVMTVLEADSERVNQARCAWVLSRIDVVEVTVPLMKSSAGLLRTHGLRGRKYASDAVLAAAALAASKPVTVLTSDPEDLTLLCGPGVEIVKV